MRILPLFLLAACFDGATTKVSVDVKAGTAHVVQQLHNAWPNEVGCGEKEGVAATNEACVEGIRARLQRGREELVAGGAEVSRAGIVLNEGELDMLFDYVAPVGAATLRDQGLAVLWMDERSPGQVKREKPGKRRVAVVAMTAEPNRNKVTVDGKYRLLTGETGGERFDIWLLRGKAASVTSEWTYNPDTDGPASPGAWLRERPGLEDALRASDLVVPPVVSAPVKG